MSGTSFLTTEFQITQDLIGVESTWNEIKKAVKSTPTMVFSVIGDSENFVSKPWQTTVFQTALIEAARSGGDSWILYRGLENGVSKIISDAYRRYVNLKCSPKSGSPSLDDVERHIKLISFAGRRIQTAASKTMQNETKAGKTDMFLLDFEEFISRQKSVFNMPVPIAVIVCEGNIETIVHISDALDRKVPVIIIKGSGKAADLVSDYLDNPFALQTNVGTLLGIGFDKNINDLVAKYLQRIGQNRQLVGIFDLDKDDPLIFSSIVGETVVRSWYMEDISQEITNDKIQSNQENKNSLAFKFLLRTTINPTKETVYQLLEEFKQLSMPCALNEKHLGPTSLPLYFNVGLQLLEEMGLIQECGPALKANRSDYVRVLLDQGVALDVKYLPELYDQVVICQDCVFKEDCPHLNSVLKQIKKEHRSFENTVNGESTDESMSKILSFSAANLAKRLCCTLLDYNAEELKTDGPSLDDNFSDILLWAILANRKELANIYWLNGKNQLNCLNSAVSI
uniref:TRPM SLOG domain-containing protein n=1 Tax=Magallana gigas TaxID=29159 RepID=A0A8W8NQX3_MAGGI